MAVIRIERSFFDCKRGICQHEKPQALNKQIKQIEIYVSNGKKLMFLETIWLVDKIAHVALFMVVAWAIARLPLFANLGLLCVVLYSHVSVTPEAPLVDKCELLNTQTACTVTGMCFNARKAFNSDFEWARYRKNVCNGLKANKTRLMYTYNTKNCAMWGACDDKECMTELGKIRDEIADFKCPFEDKEKVGLYYSNTDEKEASLYPGGILLNPTTGFSVILFVLLVISMKFFL